MPPEKLVLVLVLVPRCVAWDTVHFTVSRRNGAPTCQIFLSGDGRKIRELAGFKRAQKPVMEFSSAEALLGLCWMKVIICARAVKTTWQAVA